MNDFSKLNEFFADLIEFRRKNTPLEKINIHLIGTEGEQGQTSEIVEIYKLYDDCFVKLTINTDSYGDNEFVNGIQFVKPVTKEILVYE